MTLRNRLHRLLEHEGLNFVVTNRIPRRLATRFMGWFSRIEQPLVRDVSIAVWRLFADVDLSDAREPRFRSLHHGFVRELRPGARPVDPDPDVLVSPCDAIVGSVGTISGTELLQVKGSPYSLRELLRDDALVEAHRGGRYATLRLTAGMYHRFHAPHDCRIERVTHVWGDVWNVNAATLRRVDRLYCRNERAIVATTHPGSGHRVTLVPVAAVLVAGIRLGFLDLYGDGSRRQGGVYPCDATFRKGEELGWFEHGSTIIVLAPGDYELCVDEGSHIRMGVPLMRQNGAARGIGAPLSQRPLAGSS